MYPNINVVCGDATSMPYEPGMFDLVMESTMFVQLTDEALSRSIAQEMLRVTKPGGYLLLIDWRYGKPRNADYCAFSRARIARLFSIGSATQMVCTKRAALVPTVGRALSRHWPAVYFLVQATLPFLVGAKASLLRKALP
jgi:SAM-dependent methyltransferase